MKSAIDVKMDLLYSSPAAFVEAFNDLGGAIIKVDDMAIQKKTFALGRLLGQTMMLADALGRKRLLMEFDAKSRRKQPSRFMSDLTLSNFGAYGKVAPVAFTEAYEDLLEREPRLVKSREEIARAYSGDNGFAILKLPMRLAEQARFKLTQRIQRAIADLAAAGESTPTAAKKIAEIGNFSRSYAETVFRTNLATAFTAGRMRQMQDPEIMEVTPAFEFETVGDVDVRPNHRATKGLIARVDSPAWDQYAPPLGFNCRCDLRVVDRYELKDKGLLDQIRKAPHYPPTINAGGADAGFRVQRTDKKVYGFRAGRTHVVELRPWMVYG
jgi:SPP1 gp7 family putative phage head morphogenesis protein